MDNALNSEIEDFEGVLDYCCYMTPFKSDENIRPALLARGKGLFNVKLLKLHGSMNWLQCQRCQRLFVTFSEKIAVEEYLSEPKCRLCEKNFANHVTHDGGALLISQLIMPTFLKDLNNVQIKLIWQNACVELSEATKIIFMGYSFPSADFELRQLLARSVRHNAEIEVILKNQPSDVNKDCPELRYRSFLGKRKLKVIYGGVEDYINKITS
jgi:NAD-dependent SIR2 family protein deacetylase